eukprot:1146989-Pelagomonas_calceolata.AAC.2
MGCMAHRLVHMKGNVVARPFNSQLLHACWGIRRLTSPLWSATALLPWLQLASGPPPKFNRPPSAAPERHKARQRG